MPANTAMQVTGWTAQGSRTQPNFGDEVFDGISTNNAVVWMLRQSGNIKVSEGGRTFTHPLMYAVNSSFAARAHDATIPTPDPQTHTHSEWNVRTISGSITLFKLHQAMNQGKAVILKYLEEKKSSAVVSITEALGDQSVDGTGTDPDWDSLETIISATNTTTVGGIAGSDASWRNYSAAIAGAFNTSNNGITAMDAMVRGTTFGNKSPRAIFTTSAVYGLYYISQAGNIRYYNEELADAHFEHLNFGRRPVLWDDNIDAGLMYGVDTDSLWLQVLKQGNLVTTEFMPSTNQLSDQALMYLFGNFTTGSRRTQGVITGITS
jgi:hypothetical protein